MTASTPAPTCRRPNCPQPAVAPHGFCLTHDLQYTRWRVWRDELEAGDLADAGVLEGQQPDTATARALDALWRHLTPGPFPGEHE